MNEHQPMLDKTYSLWLQNEEHGPLRSERYEGTLEHFAQRPRIMIILTNFGLDESLVQSALLELPREVGLSISPYVNDPSEIGRQVAASGRMLLIDLPLESSNYPARDSGPLTLLHNATRAENDSKIRAIARGFGIVDTLVAVGGERFVENDASREALITSLRQRDVSLIAPPQYAQVVDADSPPHTGGIFVRAADLVLDYRLGADELDRVLSELEQIADRQRRMTVAVGPIHPMLIRRIAKWAAGLSEKHIELASIDLEYLVTDTSQDEAEVQNRFYHTR